MSGEARKPGEDGKKGRGWSAKGQTDASKTASFHFFMPSPRPDVFEENREIFQQAVGSRYGKVAVFFESADRPTHFSFESMAPKKPIKDLREVERLMSELGAIALRESSSEEERAAIDKLVAGKKKAIADARQKVDDQYEFDMLVFKEDLKQHSKDVRDYAEKFRDVWDALLWPCCSSAMRAKIQSNREEYDAARSVSDTAWLWDQVVRLSRESRMGVKGVSANTARAAYNSIAMRENGQETIYRYRIRFDETYKAYERAGCGAIGEEERTVKFLGSLSERYNPFKQYVGLKYTGANAPCHPASLRPLWVLQRATRGSQRLRSHRCLWCR